MLWPLYHQGGEGGASTQWIGSHVGPKSWDAVGKEKFSCTWRESNPNHPVCNQVLYWLSNPSRIRHKNKMSSFLSKWNKDKNLKFPNAYFTSSMILRDVWMSVITMVYSKHFISNMSNSSWFPSAQDQTWAAKYPDPKYMLPSFDWAFTFRHQYHAY
jgi:hypothetical protein